MKVDLEKLYTVPAKMEDIPLYVKQEDIDGNIHIYVYDHALKAYDIEVSHRAICDANDNCTMCPLYSKVGSEEQCYY